MRFDRVALLAVLLVAATLATTNDSTNATAARSISQTMENLGYPQPLAPQGIPDELTRLRAAHPMSASANPWEEIDFTNQSSALWRFVYDVVTQDNYAYCVAPFGLMILDVSTPASPMLVSQADIPITGGLGCEIALSGGYAYVAGGAAGLCVYDITDPLAPTFIANYGPPTDQVAVQSGFAYVSTDAGFKIFSLADPSAPTELGTVWILGYVADIAVVSDRAYLANSTQGLTILDISDPYSPGIVGTVSLGGDIWQVAVDDLYAYVSDQWFGLRILDLSSSATPSVVGAYQMAGGAYALELSGDVVYLSERTGDSAKVIRAVDVTDRSNPQQIGSILPNGYPVNLQVDGNRVYAAANTGGLQIVDASIPATPVIEGAFEIPGRVTTAFLVGGYAYVGAQGLQVLTWLPPARPAVVASLPVFPADLSQVGNFAYVAAADSGIVILDVTDPASPVELGKALLAGSATGVAVAGDVAYLAASDAGLQIVEVTNPNSPTLIKSFALPGTAYDVVAMASHAFVAAGPYGIHVVDVSNPALPLLVTTFTSPGIDARRMALKGNYLYAAGGDKFLVIQISAAAAPVLAASLDLTTICISLQGDYALLGTHWGVYAVNITYPIVPVLTGLYDDNQFGLTAVHGMATSQDFVFAASYTGLRVLSYDRVFSRGDVNVDGKQTAADIIYLVNYVFKSGQAPQPSLYAGDMNGDWSINTSDIIVQVNYLFKSP